MSFDIETGRIITSVDLPQLSEELEAASISGYETVLNGNAQVTLRFVDGASQASQDAASAILTAHVPGSKHVKVYRYVDGKQGRSRLSAPLDIDYVTGLTYRLHPTNSIIVDGEIRRIEYFVNASMNPTTGVVTYSDLVVREDFAYTRDALGFARARLQTISWYREDGTPHPQTKQRMKYYETDESLREGQRRRQNIVDKLAMDTAGWLMATQTSIPSVQARIEIGRQFARYWKTSFDMFIDASQTQILYDIRDDQAHPWLDTPLSASTTIRSTMLAALNIWKMPL